jgi:uncharacterized delta-60 repeat protein
MRRVWALVALVLAVCATAALAAGGRDPTFETNGFAIVDDPGAENESLADVQVLPDGKILAVGGHGGAGGFLVLRLNPDGSPDGTFGPGGIRVQPDNNLPGDPRVLSGMETQPDGRIVAAGLGRGPGGFNAFGFARYLSGGGVDSSFGDGGGIKVVGAPAGYVAGDAFDVAVAGGGRVVGAGSLLKMGGGSLAAALALDSSGQPVPSFGGGGTGFAVVNVPGSTGEQANAVEALPGGGLLLGGVANGAFLAKLDDSGQLVPDFGSGGMAVHDLGTSPSSSGSIEDLEVLNDGRILATGSSAPGQLFVARFLANGDVDPSFGTGGKVLLDPTPALDAGLGLALTSDGRILVAGISHNDDLNSAVWVLRLLHDGAPDLAFGPVGDRVFDLTEGLDGAAAVALQPDGKAVIAGSASPGGGASQLMVGRLRGDPRPGSCFGKTATITGTPKGESIRGTRRRDVIAAQGGRDRIRGLGGNDVACGGAGSDVIRAGAGRDRVNGGQGNDRLFGGTGKDLLLGGSGKDRLGGGGGPDLCRGGSGRDLAGCEREPGVP